MHRRIALLTSISRTKVKTLCLCFCLILAHSVLQSQDSSKGRAIEGVNPVQTQGPLRIGIALPFHASGVKQNALSDAMLDYYLGLKLAFQELEADGFKANVSVFDTEPTDSIPLNQLAIKSIAANKNFIDNNIIIGPVYEQNFKDLISSPAGSWVNSSGNKPNLASVSANNVVTEIVPGSPQLWISPLTYIKPKSQKGLTTGPFPNINFFINDTLRYKSVAKNIVRMFPKHRICLIIDAGKTSKPKALIYKASMAKSTTKLITIHTMKDGVLTPALPKRDSLLLVACTDDVAVRTPLEKLLEKRQQCWVIADLSWFEDKRYYSGLNDDICIYPTVNFTDFHDTATLHFSKKFFATYGSEPSRFAFIGYDQGAYVGLSAMAFGPNFVSSLPDATFEGLINSIHIRGGGSAPYNDGIRFVVIYEDTPHLFNQ